MHAEDLKDGRSFAEVAKRVSRKKPIVMLKAGRTQLGARAAASHTGALAGNDRIYDDVLRQSGVIRANSLNEMLEFARGLPVLPTPGGENVVIITGAGGSGVLLSDACVDNGLSLMTFPEDLDEAFKLIQKAVQLEPTNAAFLDSLGWVIYRLGKPEEALNWLLKSIEYSDEPDPTLYDHLGDIYSTLGHADKAHEAWKKSLSIEPNDDIQKKLDSPPGSIAPKP